MDEYDRAEDERLGHSLEKYSVADGQKNTTPEGGVKGSMRNVDIDRVFVDFGDTEAEQLAIDSTVAGLVDRGKVVWIKVNDA